MHKATGHRVLGGCPCKHTQISAQALQPRFLQAESLNLSAWYPPCSLMPHVGFARLITGSSAGGFLSAALLQLCRMAQKSPAPWHCSSDCKACVRKDKPEIAESWAAKFLPQPEFVLSSLQCCSQYKGPGIRENLMVTIKKGWWKDGNLFEQRNPQTLSRLLNFASTQCSGSAVSV